MDSIFYIVVILLVILKLLIWVCVFYSRAQRARMAQCQGGILIIQDGRRRILIPGNSELNINQLQGGVENPQVVTTMPPSYDEVLQTKRAEVDPPAYDQVLQSANTYQVSNTIAQPSDIIVGRPPSYTPHATDSSFAQQQQQQQQQQNQQHELQEGGLF